jgi:hypothetical protein
MTEGLKDRCSRICKSNGAPCFIQNKNQLTCISDMLINNMLGITSIIEFIRSETDPETVSQYLDEALNISKELVNWVKYLQITHDIKQMKPLFCENGKPEMRQEWRYPMPGIYQEYLSLYLKLSNGQIIPALLMNFSKTGIQFSSPHRFESRVPFDCVLGTSHLVGKEVRFRAKPRYIIPKDDEFIVGAKVIEVSDSGDLDFFRSVHEFISENGIQNLSDAPAY